MNKEETKCYCGHTTYCDCIPLEVKVDILDFNQIVKEPKQETFEEFEIAALKYNEQFIGGQESRYAAEDFINGAKWQQERICDSEVIQRIRASKSDAEARRIIRTI